MINNLSSVHSFIWSAAVNLDYTNFEQMASFHVNIISSCKTIINIYAFRLRPIMNTTQRENSGIFLKAPAPSPLQFSWKLHVI